MTPIMWPPAPRFPSLPILTMKNAKALFRLKLARPDQDRFRLTIFQYKQTPIEWISQLNGE